MLTAQKRQPRVQVSPGAGKSSWLPEGHPRSHSMSCNLLIQVSGQPDPVLTKDCGQSGLLQSLSRERSRED